MITLCPMLKGFARNVREVLLSNLGDCLGIDRKDATRKIFKESHLFPIRYVEKSRGKKIAVTNAADFADYVHRFLHSSPQVYLHSDEESKNTEKVLFLIDLLLEQIDIARTGIITIADMNDFLFPEASPKESGVLIFLSRKSFISALPRTVGPASSEMSVMQAVISLGKELHVQIVPKKNGEISSRNAKLILQKCCQLSSDEANMLLRGLDADSSLEVSPYEMKRWLFPESLSTQQGHRLVHHSSSDAIVSPKSSPEKNIKGTIFKFAEYSSLAQRLRNALHDFDKRSVEEAQSYAAQLFSRCEGSLEDALTHEEFQHFIWESELDLFRDIEDEAAKQLYATTLIEQIDINRDGSISFRELRDFIWTRQDQRELGLIIQQAREAVLAFAGPRITTESTDEVIVDIVAAFAKSFPCNHDFTCLRQGHVVDSRNLRSAFTSLLVRDRGDRTPSATDKEEALSLMLTIDANGDAVVSGTELRSWLFPNIASYSKLATYLWE